jgi:hypothetical protein
MGEAFRVHSPWPDLPVRRASAADSPVEDGGSAGARGEACSAAAAPDPDPHTDRPGDDACNQKLSERRADAVRDYLVSKGVDKAKIETIGLGEKQPIVQCDQKNRTELIACLQPNRRVEMQAKGEATK